MYSFLFVYFQTKSIKKLHFLLETPLSTTWKNKMATFIEGLGRKLVPIADEGNVRIFDYIHLHIYRDLVFNFNSCIGLIR